MFKRNQVEEAIAVVLEPGAAKLSSETRTRLKRLLETDRSLGRNKRSPDPESANFAFHSKDAPGRGLENWFTGYEAFALLTGLRLMRDRWPQGTRGCRAAPRETEYGTTSRRILRQDPVVLFDEGQIRGRAKPGDAPFNAADPVYLVINSRDAKRPFELKPGCHMPRPGRANALYKGLGTRPDLDSDGTWDIDPCPLFSAG